QGEWSNPIPVEVTGVSGTATLGSETVVATALVTVTGFSATGALGNETVTGTAPKVCRKNKLTFLSQ
ncbi:MAG: hypothetical protein ACPF80_05875, partial [Flavobacteriaceae bacterium]